MSNIIKIPTQNIDAAEHICNLSRTEFGQSIYSIASFFFDLWQYWVSKKMGRWFLQKIWHACTRSWNRKSAEFSIPHQEHIRIFLQVNTEHCGIQLRLINHNCMLIWTIYYLHLCIKSIMFVGSVHCCLLTNMNTRNSTQGIQWCHTCYWAVYCHAGH